MTTTEIFTGVLPSFLSDMVVVALAIAVPGLVLWLPPDLG